MRSRFVLYTVLIAIGLFAVPHLVQASIPNFGPIIPKDYQSCPLGWGMLIAVAQSIIEISITIAITFVAPIMIAYAGFLYVVNPANPSGVSKAHDILTSAIIGIVIALSAWLIVTALLTALTGTSSWLDSVKGTEGCLEQKGAQPDDKLNEGETAPSLIVGSTSCSGLSLTPITDSAAQQMEAMNGDAVIWDNTDSRLKPCVDKFRNKVGGTVTSAYRPQSYQAHLYQVHDLWCNKGLNASSDPACSDIKSEVSAEIQKHSLGACQEVASSNSNHGSGLAVDITGINQSSDSVKQAASDSCLTWFGPGDKVHYTLKSGCSCG